MSLDDIPVGSLNVIDTNAAGDGRLAGEIMPLQDERLKVVGAILGEGAVASSAAASYIARVRRRLRRRDEEAETTGWALDGDEEGDEGIWWPEVVKGTSAGVWTVTRRLGAFVEAQIAQPLQRDPSRASP